MITSAHPGLLGAVLFGYGALALAYALGTPIWQVPDEPAHFNYVAHVVENRSAPRIETGDYPHQRLEALKASRFADPLAIEGIEYEDHQPPLYYALAATAVTATRAAGATAEVVSAARTSRLVGVVLGALTVLVAWRVAGLAVPGEPAVALGAAAFVAFLPMNLTVTAAVNNDALATLVASCLVWLALMRADGRLSVRRYALIGGLAFGAALLTKATLYGLGTVVVAGGLLGGQGRMRPGTRLRTFLEASAPVALGAVLAAPWFARNLATYGALDPLGLAAHDSVVVGQPRTAAWIAAEGVQHTLARGVVYTFESFWGVFGWMGVFLAPWAYGVLAIATLAALTGLALRATRWRRDSRPVSDNAALLGMTLAVTAGGFVLYNLAFVQHQGRYLFPALVPIALAFSMGFYELGGAAGRALGGSDQLGRCFGAATVVAGAAALALLAVLSLQRYVIPGLSP